MISNLFERICPTPNYPKGVNESKLKNYSWDSKSESIIVFKDHLKKHLRKVQYGRCAFCRRHLGDFRDTHLEHFVEKSVYPEFRFTITNISLSCSTCNGKKEHARVKLLTLLKQRAARNGRDQKAIKVSPSLSGFLNTSAPVQNQYRLVHPYFDKYSENITIRRNWVYVPGSRKGFRTIRSLQLNELATIEKTARRERLLSKNGFVSLLGSAIFSESENATVKEILSDLSFAIIERRKINSSRRDFTKLIVDFPTLLNYEWSSESNKDKGVDLKNMTSIGTTNTLLLPPPPNKKRKP